MPTRNADLHGNVPDKSPVALLLVDVINDMEWEDGELLYRYALPMARRLAKLKKRARQEKIPIIYVNDNFGKWRSDFRKLIGDSLRRKTRRADHSLVATTRRRLFHPQAKTLCVLCHSSRPAAPLYRCEYACAYGRCREPLHSVFGDGREFARL